MTWPSFPTNSEVNSAYHQQENVLQRDAPPSQSYPIFKTHVTFPSLVDAILLGLRSSLKDSNM